MRSIDIRHYLLQFIHPFNSPITWYLPYPAGCGTESIRTGIHEQPNRIFPLAALVRLNQSFFFSMLFIISVKSPRHTPTAGSSANPRSSRIIIPNWAAALFVTNISMCSYGWMRNSMRYKLFESKLRNVLTFQTGLFVFLTVLVLRTGILFRNNSAYGLYCPTTDLVASKSLAWFSIRRRMPLSKWCIFIWWLEVFKC